jgi:hypothetical protein
MMELQASAVEPASLAPADCASVGAQPRRRRCLPRRRLAWVPPSGGSSPRSRYSRPRTGRSTPSVAAEIGAVWLPGRIAGPGVVVAEPVVVGSPLVVVASVVVGSAVVVGAVVLGSAVVVGAVTGGWVVVAPNVDGASVVVVPPAVVARVSAVAGPVGVVGPLPASGTVSGVVGDGAGEVVGSREAMVVVDADVGAGSAGRVGSATPGARRGGDGWWGTRVAEATRAARTAAVSPKAKNSSRQGRRGVARCRGRRIGMVASSRFDSFFRLTGCPWNAYPYQPQRV